MHNFKKIQLFFIILLFPITLPIIGIMAINYALHKAIKEKNKIKKKEVLKQNKKQEKTMLEHSFDKKKHNKKTLKKAKK